MPPSAPTPPAMADGLTDGQRLYQTMRDSWGGSELLRWDLLPDYAKANWEVAAIRRAEKLATLKEQPNGPV